MNLLGLAEIESAAGNRTGALTHLDEAERLATDTGSHGVLTMARQVRNTL